MCLTIQSRVSSSGALRIGGEEGVELVDRRIAKALDADLLAGQDDEVVVTRGEVPEHPSAAALAHGPGIDAGIVDPGLGIDGNAGLPSSSHRWTAPTRETACELPEIHDELAGPRHGPGPENKPARDDQHAPETMSIHRSLPAAASKPNRPPRLLRTALHCPLLPLTTDYRLLPTDTPPPSSRTAGRSSSWRRPRAGCRDNRPGATDTRRGPGRHGPAAPRTRRPGKAGGRHRETRG